MGSSNLYVKMLSSWWVILLSLLFAKLIILAVCFYLKKKCDKRRKLMINSESTKCETRRNQNIDTESNNNQKPPFRPQISTVSRDTVSTIDEVNSVKSEIFTLKQRLSELESQVSKSSELSLENDDVNATTMSQVLNNTFWNLDHREMKDIYAEVQDKVNKESVEPTDEIEIIYSEVTKRTVEDGEERTVM